MERNLKVILNGKEVFGYAGQKILDLCAENGIEIPTLCYDKHLSIHGGCSLCLVEVKGARSLMRACSTPIHNGMELQTHTDRIFGARQLALQLLLSDHVGDCRPPCQLACPARGDVKGYVNYAAQGEYRAALEALHENITLPASIGRVCPAPCEEKCRRHFVDEEPVSIREIKRFVGDWGLNQGDLGKIPEITENGKKIAIVGGGPAGVSAAYYLRKKGYSVTIYDKEALLGGMMRYGIPDYRLPQTILQKEIDWILSHGIETRLETTLGVDVTLEELKKSNDAVLLAIGCWKSMPMKVPGESLEGVMGGIDYLYEVNNGRKVELGSKVAVVGGGNTAMDAARCALRSGAEKVSVIYRRTREEMPAENIEIEEAMEEGIEFVFLAAPVAVEGNGKVQQIVCEKMKLGDADASGRRRPLPTGEQFTLEVDTVIAAIGQGAELALLPDNLHDGRKVKSDRHFATPEEGVFVCGDLNTGPDIAVGAIGEGHWAAESIHHFITEGVPHRPFECDVVRTDLGPEDFLDEEKQPREHPVHCPSDVRLSRPFQEYNLGLTEDQVIKDGSRCMKCGCPDLYECKLREYGTQYEADPETFSKEEYSRPSRTMEANKFYLRNMDKCIQCGICVRTCSQKAIYSAIEFQNRGMKTLIGPGVEKSIEDSDCVFCGQCVQLCPTGALTENNVHAISRPSHSRVVKTVCSYCGVGCELNIHVDELTGKVWNVTTDYDSPTGMNEGRCCVKGRFGWSFIHSKDRLTKPLIKENGVFREASWDEAIGLVAKKFTGHRDTSGPDSVAFFTSARCTNEENYLLQRFAREVMGTNNVDHCAHL
jgi:formate dehydrogenase major subunit